MRKKKKLKKSELPKTMRLEATKKVKEIIAISDFLTPKMSDIFKKNLIHAIAQSFREAR